MAESNRYQHHRCYHTVFDIGLYGCLFRYKRFHVSYSYVPCSQPQSSLLRDCYMGLITDLSAEHHAFYFLVERKEAQKALVSIISDLL